MVKVSGQFLQLILIITTFLYFSPNIIYLALAIFLANSTSTLVRVIFSRKLLPELKISFDYFDKTKLKELFSYSLWVVISQTAFLMILNTDYIIINKLIGSGRVAEYSLAARWSEIIRSTITAAVMVITPQAIHFEASKEWDNLRKLLIKSTRICLTLLIPSCFILAIFAQELIIIWVGNEFLEALPVFWFALIPLPFILSNLPASSVLTGSGNVKRLALSGIIAAIANISLSILFVKWFELGIVGVALGTAIALIARDFFYIPLYVSKYLKISPKSYYKQFLLPLLCSLVMIAIAIMFKIYININSWIILLMICFFTGTVFLIISYFVIFDHEEKSFVKSIIDKILKHNKSD